MLKKYRLVVSILVIGLLSGGMVQSVGASASMDAPKQDSNNKVEQQSQYQTYYDWDSFFTQFFSGKNNRWYTERKYHQTPVEPTPVKPVPNQNKVPEDVQSNDAPAKTEDTQISPLNEFEQQVLSLTNVEREKYGLPAFQVDLELSRVAREKSRDIQINNYFDHNSPIYGSPFDMMIDYGIVYRTAGENIAKGQQSPSEVVNAWMNSEGHRANILNGSFTHLGVGYHADGNVWTQQFIGQ